MKFFLAFLIISLNSCITKKITNSSLDDRHNIAYIDGIEVPDDFDNQLCSDPEFKENTFPALNIGFQRREIPNSLINSVIEYSVPNLLFPFNPAIVALEDGYLMSTRFDCTERTDKHFQSYTLIMELNKDFTPRSSATILRKPSFNDPNIESHTGEDLRLFREGDKIFALANDNKDGTDTTWESRRQHLYQIEKIDDKWQARLISRLEKPSESTIPDGPEKNWVFIDNQNVEDSKFGYILNPFHTIVGVEEGEEIQANASTESSTEYSSTCFTHPPWDKDRFGELRGGTPSLYDEELGGYIAIFHSVKKIEGGKEYYMGAYVVSNDNHCISHISPEPILYDKMYEERPGFWITLMGPEAKVVFPTGLERGIVNQKQVYIISAGVNDSTVKNFIINRDELHASLLNTDREMSRRLQNTPSENIREIPAVNAFLEEHQVVASFTSSPKRLHLIRPMLDTIYNSEYLDEIILSLPERYGPTGETYIIPAWLNTDYPKLKILRPAEDLGPITKIIPAVRYLREINPSDPDAIVISFDDDIGYIQGTISQLIKNVVLNPNTVVGGSTQELTYWNIENANHWSQGSESTVIEGFGAIAYRIGYVDDLEMEQIVKAERNCLVSDDLVISYVLNKSEISRLQISNDYMGIDKNFQFTYGFGMDALHKGGGLDESTSADLNASKYQKCNNYLQRLSNGIEHVPGFIKKNLKYNGSKNLK